MTAAQRLETLVAHMHTNVKALADLCGYERPQAFYDILKGKTRNISPTVCDRLISVFPRLSRIWLMTGEGPMIEEQRPMEQRLREPLPTDLSGRERLAETAPTAVKMVPLVQLTASAGPIASYYESGVELEKCPKIISPNPQAELAVPVSGDSMEPLFPDGAILFIKKINEAAFIPWGHAMVLDTENGVFVKNVMPDVDNETYIWAESINPRYPKMHIPKQAIFALYRVLSYNKPFFAQ